MTSPQNHLRKHFISMQSAGLLLPRHSAHRPLVADASRQLTTLRLHPIWLPDLVGQLSSCQTPRPAVNWYLNFLLFKCFFFFFQTLLPFHTSTFLSLPSTTTNNKPQSSSTFSNIDINLSLHLPPSSSITFPLFHLHLFSSSSSSLSISILFHLLRFVFSRTFILSPPSPSSIFIFHLHLPSNLISLHLHLLFTFVIFPTALLCTLIFLAPSFATTALFPFTNVETR